MGSGVIRGPGWIHNGGVSWGGGGDGWWCRSGWVQAQVGRCCCINGDRGRATCQSIGAWLLTTRPWLAWLLQA